MTVRVTKKGPILLEGVCAIEDAEVLLAGLLANPGTDIDWSGCEQAHTAVIQILMAVHPKIIGWPTNPFFRTHLAGLFTRLA